MGRRDWPECQESSYLRWPVLRFCALTVISRYDYPIKPILDVEQATSVVDLMLS